MSEKQKIFCPDCGGKMSFDGYRPLFPKCIECEKTFHLEKCRSIR